MKKTDKKPDSKLGLFGASLIALSGMVAAGPALAQDAVAEAEESEEEIIVTGSRLRRESFDNPNPTVQVGQEELADRQLANLGDAIEDIPLVGLGGNTRGTQGQNGDSLILPDILDLGSQRTLTLLNGRRIQPTLPGTVFVPGNASGSQVDLSTINPAIIERVEVIAGTGGAIYGADAVGGVVNIITRDDFEGFDISSSIGITEIGDGEQYRVAGLWGGNFLNDRLNVTLSADYFNQELITASTETAARYLGSGITNQLDGSARRSNPTASQLADALRAGTPVGDISAFLPSTTDGISSVFFGPLDLTNPLVSSTGVLLTDERLGTGFGATSAVIPALPINNAFAGTITLNTINVPFFAPTSLGSLTPAQVFTAFGVTPSLSGLSAAQVNALALSVLQANRPTPFEYYQSNPSLNPLLFLGTFGTAPNVTGAGGAVNTANGYYPTITNTDPATSALFPRVAVPLAFDAAGNLVDYDFGDYGPGQRGLLASAFGSGGYDSTRAGHLQIQAGTERTSLGALSNFEVTNNVLLRTELFYSKITFDQIVAPDSQSPTGSTQAGTLAIPIFINQNPYLSSQALARINLLNSQGLTLPVFDIDPTAGVNNQQVMYMGRNLSDIFVGPNETTAEVENYRAMLGAEGDFNLLNRDFYWDVAAYYGVSQTEVVTTGINDIEFALAIDVVDGPAPGVDPVCRQQTLASPVSITTFNPGLTAAVVISPLVGLTPTAAQVAACVPLNLFGSGPISAAAIDYVTSEQDSSSENTLEVYSGSMGGDLIALPAGWAQLGLQVEHRVEAAKFEPGSELLLGTTRNALQFTGGGERTFLEYGVEASVPIFGDDFNLPFFRELEVGYAWRYVERDQSTEFFASDGAPTEDDTFNYYFRWKPNEDITFRGARTRTVRAASLVELFDPGIRAFGQLSAQSHPCSTANIDTGPSPLNRRANCVAAVIAYGYAPDATTATTFLSTFVPTLTPNRPATAAGNPFLVNEESNAYTLGLTYEPHFIPRLTFAVDFFSVDLSGELGLVGPPTTTNACFDSPAFPNSVVGAANPACDTVLFTASGNPTPFGTFAVGTIPGINPLTGAVTVPGAAFGGQAANPNSPFEIAALDFLNLNLALRQLRSVNWEARYNFPLGDLPFVGGLLENAGDMYLRATLYHTQRYDVFTPTLNRQDQEHTFPEFESRMEFRHNVGPFDHTLQWFWQSETLTNIQITTPLADQSPAFVASDAHYFNYFASYDLNDAVTMRLTVNNLTDTQDPRGQYGVGTNADGGLGREFIVGVSARF